MGDGGGVGRAGAWRPQGHGEFKEPEENLRHCSLPISSPPWVLPSSMFEFPHDLGLILVFQLFLELPGSAFFILSK